METARSFVHSAKYYGCVLSFERVMLTVSWKSHRSCTMMWSFIHSTSMACFSACFRMNSLKKDTCTLYRQTPSRPNPSNTTTKNAMLSYVSHYGKHPLTRPNFLPLYTVYRGIQRKELNVMLLRFYAFKDITMCFVVLEGTRAGQESNTDRLEAKRAFNPRATTIGRKARVFVPSGLIGIMQSSSDFDPRLGNRFNFSMTFY